MVNSTLHVPPCKYKKWQIMVDLLHSNSTGPVSFELKLTFTKAKKKKKKKRLFSAMYFVFLQLCLDTPRHIGYIILYKSDESHQIAKPEGLHTALGPSSNL